ncbi:hypothetical protein H0H92_011940 [Tricholoma furcatifolium]|nr:hypothetical protein H0H92_011940 [Tricholoma furcatifolium]
MPTTDSTSPQNNQEDSGSSLLTLSADWESHLCDELPNFLDAARQANLEIPPHIAGLCLMLQMRASAAESASFTDPPPSVTPHLTTPSFINSTNHIIMSNEISDLDLSLSLSDMPLSPVLTPTTMALPDLGDSQELFWEFHGLSELSLSPRSLKRKRNLEQGQMEENVNSSTSKKSRTGLGEYAQAGDTPYPYSGAPEHRNAGTSNLQRQPLITKSMAATVLQKTLNDLESDSLSSPPTSPPAFLSPSSSLISLSASPSAKEKAPLSKKRKSKQRNSKKELEKQWIVSRIAPTVKPRAVLFLVALCNIFSCHKVNTLGTLFSSLALSSGNISQSLISAPTFAQNDFDPWIALSRNMEYCDLLEANVVLTDYQIMIAQFQLLSIVHCIRKNESNISMREIETKLREKAISINQTILWERLNRGSRIAYLIAAGTLHILPIIAATSMRTELTRRGSLDNDDIWSLGFALCNPSGQ